MRWRPAGCFVDGRQLVLPVSTTMSPDDFVGYLSTVSAYLMLSPGDLAATLDAIRGVLPEQVSVRADVTVQLARGRAS